MAACVRVLVAVLALPRLLDSGRSAVIDIASSLASADDVIARALVAWKPPTKLTVSQWADAHFYLSAESSAQAGRWKTIPYQREPMDAISDPRVERVTLMKSARIGYTKMIDAAIGYSIDQDPCSQMVVQPTVEDAKGFSKEEIAPMIRDTPRLAKIVIEDAEDRGPKDTSNTILHKKYPGGVLSMVGANSGAGFRRISRKKLYLDEVDGYPPSAGSDGDPVKLAEKRTEYFHDRKIVAGSTPKLAGSSRIEQMFEAGDQRRYYVPCPQCDHMDYLVFTRRNGEDGQARGHYMLWPDGAPREAHFVCSKNGCVIEHQHKRDMVTKGEWRAAKKFEGHASFHIWAAYSFSPNAGWGQLAEEFLEAKRNGPLQLQTFVNTALGETWREAGEAPEWENLYARREHYQIGTVPDGVRFLTAGVDVQKDRFVYEIVGWGNGRASWSIDVGVLPADTSNLDSYVVLDELLDRTFASSRGPMTVLMLAIDSGYNTQMVYNWVRRKPPNRVIATKGVSTARTFVGSPTPVDVMHNGKRIARGCKVWPVGVDLGKTELYGWLKLGVPSKESGAPYPSGFCHFPELGEDYFKQLTAEHLVSLKHKRTGRVTHEWQILPGRENHWLDTRVYARAAAAVAGLDRLRDAKPAENSAPAEAVAAPPATGTAEPLPNQPRAPAPPRPRKQITDSPFLNARARGWLTKRR